MIKAEDHEVWKDVAGYEGHYQISNLGNYRSVDRWVYSNRGGNRFCKCQPIITWLSKKGYVHAYVAKNNRKKSIHRLVAEAFLPILKTKLP